MVAPAKEEEKNRNFCIFFSTSRERSHILESFVFKKVHHERRSTHRFYVFIAASSAYDYGPPSHPHPIPR